MIILALSEFQAERGLLGQIFLNKDALQRVGVKTVADLQLGTAKIQRENPVYAYFSVVPDGKGGRAVPRIPVLDRQTLVLRGGGGGISEDVSDRQRSLPVEATLEPHPFAPRLTQ